MEDFKIPKIETRLEVKNETTETADLYLYGNIRKAYWWDGNDESFISADRVKKALADLKSKNINVHINSGGGDVFESIAIGNLLKQHDGDINVIVDGLAGSGASVIAMAGKTIQMFPNSMMMIHKAWTWADGNADELRDIADELDKIDTAVRASYKARFIGTEDELKELISDESWLTADECKVFGFCDEIFDEDSEEGEEENEPVKASLFEKYKAVAQVNEPTKKTLFDNFKGGNE